MTYIDVVLHRESHNSNMIYMKEIRMGIIKHIEENLNIPLVSCVEKITIGNSDYYIQAS